MEEGQRDGVLHGGWSHEGAVPAHLEHTQGRGDPEATWLAAPTLTHDQP